MVTAFDPRDPWAMYTQPTVRARFAGIRAPSTVLRWAGSYALPAGILGAGVLLTGPSAGIGWALIVFGAGLAAVAAEARSAAAPSCASTAPVRTSKAGCKGREWRST
jgi:hypothetical protein